MTAGPANPFARLQARHEALLARQPQEGSGLVEEALAYADEIRRESAHVTGARERSQLRANLRYWAGFIHEHTGVYPPTELAPPLAGVAPTDEPGARQRRTLPLTSAILLLLLLLACWLAFRYALPAALPPATLPIDLTAVLTPSVRPSATDEPAEEATDEPAEEATEEPSPGNPEPVEVSPLTTVSLTNFRDGDAVGERALLRGIYRQLDESWTLHLLVQPVAGDGRLYPAPDFVNVESDEPDGEWELVVDFAVPGIERARFVNLFLVLARGERARTALANAAQQGLSGLPPGAILLPDVTTLIYAP